MARDYKAEKINRKHWDEVAPVHHRSYDTRALVNGGHDLDATQVKELGNISGKTILHLQCHIGTDTLSLARLGAEVTGIDILSYLQEVVKPPESYFFASLGTGGRRPDKKSRKSPKLCY